MSAVTCIPILECVYLLGCARWVWVRCTYTGADDSKTWPLADVEDFKPVPRMCQLILAVYEEDLAKPEWAPPAGYHILTQHVLKKVDYEDTRGIVPPYIIYADHEHKDIVLAIRGLNLVKESDYALLWDNKLGKQMFDGGYVHHGLLKSAAWLLDKEAGTLKSLLATYPIYTLSFTGHSLGSGVASLAVVLLTKYRFLVSNISRKRLRCYAIAPARCMSLNLAVEYADIINSIILQDDFLPRTATPLEDIFSSIFCLPCLLCFSCLRDTCIPEHKLLKDQRRLYAPGRFFHIVERKLCRCGRYPPEVRTSIPVEGRFEHIVLSCNATSDHSVVWIEREAERAIELMEESITDVPEQQKMERQQTLAKEHDEEHKVALERAKSLNIPRTNSQKNGLIDEYLLPAKTEELTLAIEQGDIVFDLENADLTTDVESNNQALQSEWDELIKSLFA
ncbi:hypothetical protein O6H91_01G019300 [Diphasiastrum complanatum]|uniref:Uncharacterized protein n=1 Tax=Diphasiastrum complanatum TaxID=34168 RepID=A0ACC2ENR2_DIPCM|nr:hypothetical protein O6H91_01G019300 [Diphasiastrum complanatum]